MVLDPLSILSAFGALIAVLALIWLAGRAARLGGLAPKTRVGRLLVVQDVISLDARRRLHLINCGERRLLLLTGGGQDVVIGWLPEQPPVVVDQRPAGDTDQ